MPEYEGGGIRCVKGLSLFIGRASEDTAMVATRNYEAYLNIVGSQGLISLAHSLATECPYQDRCKGTENSCLVIR